MDDTASVLQRASKKLPPCSTKNHHTLMEVRGACPLFSKQIYCNNSKVILDKLDLHPSPKQAVLVKEKVTQWADSKPFTLLMSEHLPVHLNLPVRTYPSCCTLFQALVLGEGLEFFILTLYDAKEVDLSPDVVEDFTMRCASMLTSQLLNYYGKDFILLPCTLEMERFKRDGLKEELEEQLSLATDYYSGPLKLTKESCQDLHQAVLILATASEVPIYFDGSEDAEKALLMADSDSDSFLRLTISQLTGEDATSVTLDYRPPIIAADNYMPPIILVVLEAARRVSYRQKVIIVSDDHRIADCVKKLAVYSSVQCYTEKDARAKFVNETSLDTTTPDTSDSKVSCSESTAYSDTARESVSITEKQGSKTGVPPRETGSSHLNQTAPCETAAVIVEDTSEELANLRSKFRYDLRVAECTDSVPDEIPQCSKPPAETVPTLKTAYPAPKGGVSEESSLEDVHELQALHRHVVCATSDEAQPNSEDVHELQAWHSHVVCDTSDEAQPKSEATPPCEEKNSTATSRDTEQERGVPVKEKPEDVCIIAIDTPGFPDCPGLRLRLTKINTDAPSNKHVKSITNVSRKPQPNRDSGIFCSSENIHFLTQVDEVSQKDACTQCDAVSSNDTSTQVDEVSPKDACTQCDAVSSNDTSTQVDEVSPKDACTQCDAVSSNDTSTQCNEVTPDASLPNTLTGGAATPSQFSLTNIFRVLRGLMALVFY